MNAVVANLVSRVDPPRLRFLLALTAAVLLYFGYAPPPVGGFNNAVHWLVMAILGLAVVIVGAALFGAAERSDGRA